MDVKKLTEQAGKCGSKIDDIRKELAKAIVGQEEVIDKLLIALLAEGHVLLEGVPGLAKTLMVKSLADSMQGSFCRIQFTPDLLPADIVGTKIYDKGSFVTRKGPIFSQFILADEINRAPPKVQSALLEAMQEKQVSIHGDTFKLDRPFLVLATQNPIETEGTYKLPEAQVDRFMMKLIISYPKKDDEKEIIRRYTQGVDITLKKVIDVKELLAMQAFVKSVYADEKIEEYVARIVDATRHPKEYNIDVDGLIEYGASPRASLWLILGAKAHAVLQGRGFVLPEDIKAVSHEVLRHRILLTYEAEAENIDSDMVVDKILAKVKSP